MLGQLTSALKRVHPAALSQPLARGPVPGRGSFAVAARAVQEASAISDILFSPAEIDTPHNFITSSLATFPSPQELSETSVWPE